jgi:hypothetical protein
MVSGKTQRRLRSLPVAKGAPSLPEDVFEFTSPIQFALDLPQPFQQPIVAVVRSVKEDSGDVILAYEDRPLESIARSKDERGLWREEIFVLPPEWAKGQVRVALSLLAQGGVGRVARVAFFASRSDDGIPLALLAPLAISPNPAAVGICHRIDGTPLLDRGEAHFNGLEMLAGSEVLYELPAEAKPRRLEFGAIAMGTAATLVVRADGVDKARYELSPNAKEPLRARLEIIGAKRLEFLVETAAGSGGSVFVLDPRVR